ncbi:MAG: helix-turn-helix domain-containing protein [Pseudomonadota bacterium]
MPRHNAKGRSKVDGQYIPLPYSMVRHAAWRSLSGGAVKVWLEIRSRYTVRGDGCDNNGELTLSLNEAARLLGMSKTTVQRAIAELKAKGFLEEITEGHWYGRKATEWRVTDCRYKGHPPSREWQKPTGEKQQSVPRRSMFNPDGTKSVPKP